MATFRHNGNVHLFRDKFIDGMTSRGYDARFRRALLQPDRGLRRIRLPREPRGELRAARLRLVLDQVPLSRTCSAPPSSTASRWASTSRPSSCATRASTASRCARPTSIAAHWDCTLEPASAGSRHRFAVRLGFRQIQGLSEEELEQADRGARQRLCQHRAAGRGRRRLALHHRAPRRGRCLPLARPRPARRAVGGAAARRDRRARSQRPRQDTSADAHLPLPLLAPHMSDELFPEPEVALPAMPLSEHVVEDYVATGLSLKAHPVHLLPRAPRRGSASCATSITAARALPQNQQGHGGRPRPDRGRCRAPPRASSS